MFVELPAAGEQRRGKFKNLSINLLMAKYDFKLSPQSGDPANAGLVARGK
jgi:hypothetical protein